MNEESKEITPETFPDHKQVPVLAGLPQHLKDPEIYPKIQKALLETLASSHSHGDMLEWSNCVPCQAKMHEHAELMRKLGFASGAQYMAWRKVHETITRRSPLVQWKNK